MKRTILFVDDEELILNGLKRMLRPMRQEWDMSFALGGPTAINLVSERQFDVVVSDMRMPEIDGAALLKEVRRVSPCSVRIILSGYSEEEAVLKTVGPAHQYLAKPCNADDLIRTIEGALTLRSYIGIDSLSCSLSGLERLPSPPATFTELISAIDNPHSTLDEITDILAKDLAMSAQTLKLTNSAYFSLSQETSSLRSAVNMLGTDTIRSLVLVAGFFKEFNGPAEMSSRIELLSRRSVGIGDAAREIANFEGLSAQQAGIAHSAGLLSHVGSLAMMAKWPDKFRDVLALVQDQGLDIVSAERRAFGASHTQIGAYLLGLWGFTDPIAEAVAFHHEPSNHPAPDPPPALACVHAAQHLVRPDNGGDRLEGLDMEFLARAGKQDHLADWLEIAGKYRD